MADRRGFRILQDTWPRNGRALDMWGRPVATPFPVV